MSGRRLLSLALLLALSTVAAGATPDPLHVLFLGDGGHHRPGDRAAQISPVLATRGIAVAYTESLADLNPGNLAKYDALLIYANIDAISPEAARALKDYVAAGGGFVPIHCASYCFRNDPEVVALMGGQFQSHGAGEFDVKDVDPAHPILRGLTPFHTWDETYVHNLHHPEGRTVLQVRPAGDVEEPWTWVRDQGKGRVFYTAYGHDARTWTNPGFHDLLERGLRWAAHKGEVFDSSPRVATGLKPFEFEPARIPRYLPGGAWGAQGKPIDQAQKPLAPAESMKHLVVPKGFEARLFAAEPDIAKPICMAWDHRGRLWIAETTDYPNDLKPRGQGRDRIKICEDTDGDGRADRFKVFAEDLSIPTSLTFAGGGVIVHQAPDTLILRDTDGDDRADVREAIFSGWGTGDTHAGPSNLRMGLDGWVYGIVGYSAFHGVVGGEKHDFAQGLYRFKPDGSKLEFLRNTSNNSWGVGFSEEGLLFGSTANGCASVFLPIPNRYYEGVRGWTGGGVLRPLTQTNQFHAVTPNVRQVDFFGGFTAGAGHALYTARTYPPTYWNRTAFVSEPTGHLTATFTLQRKGSTFAAYNGWNLIASDDEWTSPVAAEVGPDGQVWAIDWYNFIVQHNPTPEGFQTGKGGAYLTPMRDKTHGRIYRIVARDGTPSGFLKLDPSDPKGLVAGLKSDNMLWRLHAQRLLAERGKRDVEPSLIALVNDPAVDAIGLNPAAIHALWALNNLGCLDQPDGPATAAAVAALKHPSAGVRRNALMVLPRDAKTAEAIAAANPLHDPDAHVRLAALLALAESPSSDSAARAVLDGLLAGQFSGDPNLADAATIAAATQAEPFLKALAARKWDAAPPEDLLVLVGRVAEHHARGVPADTIASLLATLPDADPRIGGAIVAGLARGWPKDRPVALDAKGDEALAKLVATLPAEARSPLVGLANRWGSKGLDRYADQIAGGSLATARDESRPDADRIAAARQLVDFRPEDVETSKTLLNLITPRTSPGLATGLIDSVGHGAAAQTGAALADTLGTLTPGVRPAAVRALLGRSDWTSALLDAVEAGKIGFGELALDQVQALTAHRDKSIAARAKSLVERGGGLPDADRQKVIDAVSPVALKGGDAARGQVVFKDNCLKCHTYAVEGGKVGPDLTGMAAHPRAELLIHILDPSRSVEGNFLQYNLATTDGRVLNGLLSSESKTAVEILDAEGKSHPVLREDIDALAVSKKSVMPEGFEKQIPPEAMADLLAYLTRRGKYLPLDLRKVATVVSTRGMFFGKEGSQERLAFPDWSPRTFEGVPFQFVDPQGDRTANVVMLHGPNGSTAPTMPRSVSLPVNAPARALHFLSGVSGWGATGPDSEKTVSMVVRIRYADGTAEDHPLRNGVEFADYIRPIDVPGSKLAFKFAGDQQVRYFSIRPKRPEPIASIDLIKGPDATAPLVMAITLESAE